MKHLTQEYTNKTRKVNKMGLKLTITCFFKDGKTKSFDYKTKKDLDYIKKNILTDPNYLSSTLTTTDGSISWYDKLDEGWWAL